MILYLTDNPEIKKKINGAYLAYQIFNWKMDVVSEKNLYDTELVSFNLKHRFKKNSLKDEINKNSEIVAILTRSNYKMIYEVIFLEEEYGKKITIYFWDKWFTKKKKEYIKKIKIRNEFEKYIQRGFLTSLVYQKISFLNMQRIEQFMVFLALQLIDLNLKEFSGEISSEKYIQLPEDSEVELIDLIETIAYKNSNPIYIVDKLMYHSRKGHISDPFLGYCRFISKNTSLEKMYLSGNRKEAHTIRSLLYILGGILPYTDILKTFRYLLKNDIVFFEDDFLDFNYKMSPEELRYYLPFISKEKWNHVYEENTYTFYGIFPNIKFNELDYECPLCGSTEFKTTPLHFYCSDSLCSFRVDRIITPGGLPKNITDWDFRRLVKFGNTVIKNRLGGYNRFRLVEDYNKNGKYHVLPEIESNNVGKD